MTPEKPPTLSELLPVVLDAAGVGPVTAGDIADAAARLEAKVDGAYDRIASLGEAVSALQAMPDGDALARRVEELERTQHWHVTGEYVKGPTPPKAGAKDTWAYGQPATGKAEWQEVGDESLTVTVRGKVLSVRAVKSALLEALDLLEDATVTLLPDEPAGEKS